MEPRRHRQPIGPNSANLIASIGLTRGLHPDFGSGSWNGAPIGIPYMVVSGAHTKVPITVTAYGNESDPGTYPVLASAAGLPIFPGLVRYDEAATGMIGRALRFTAAATRMAYGPPAMHAGTTTG